MTSFEFSRKGVVMNEDTKNSLSEKMKMNGVGDAFVELAMKGQCVWKG
jgi:hypothetical protein